MGNVNSNENNSMGNMNSNKSKLNNRRGSYDAPQLSKRLAMVASLLGIGRCICDVGCDHGYLPMNLVAEGAFTRAIAMDINKGPLSKADSNISRNGMSSLIETRLSDGVKALNVGDADAVSICGMGGNIMMHIFDEGREVLKSMKTIVVQPQSEYMGFYNYILLEGYRFVDEDIALDEGKYYFAWKLEPGNDSECVAKIENSDSSGESKEYEIADVTGELRLGFYLSKTLAERHNTTYQEYLIKHKTSLDQAVISLKKNSPDNPRLVQIIGEIETIDDILHRYYN